MTPKFVYQAEFQNDTNDKMTFYVGFSETPFKKGFWNHKKEFTHEKYRNGNDLPKYMQQLKGTNTTTLATWRLVAKVFSETKINWKKNRFNMSQMIIINY